MQGIGRTLACNLQKGWSQDAESEGSACVGEGFCRAWGSERTSGSADSLCKAVATCDGTCEVLGADGRYSAILNASRESTLQNACAERGADLREGARAGAEGGVPGTWCEEGVARTMENLRELRELAKVELNFQT